MNKSFTNRKLALVFPPAFNTQTAHDTELAVSLLTARHPQTPPQFHSRVAFREETRDCGGEFIVIEKITGEIAKFTFTFDATAYLMAGWFAYLQGVTAAPVGGVQPITRSPLETPVEFSLIEGFEGDTPDGIKEYKNLVMDTWTVTGPARGKVTVTVTSYGNPDGIVLTDFEVPACVNQDPLLTKDVLIKVGPDSITDDLREFTYTESNNIDVSADALKFDGTVPNQLERGDRTASANILSLGSPTSAMYKFAYDENEAFAPLEMHFGPLTPTPEQFAIYAPNTQFRLDDSLIVFNGTRNKSAFRLLGRPSPDVDGTVTRGEYNGAYPNQFLLTA